MRRFVAWKLLPAVLLLAATALLFDACTSSDTTPPARRTPPPTPVTRAPAAPAAPIHPPSTEPTTAGVMLGIDVLAAENFAPLAGKRVGLLTHPAGVNRFGVSTVEVLRRAPNLKLVALFGPEHGIYGDAPASQNIPDVIDKRTGLPAYSLFGKNRRPTREQLRGLDALVIDLQDIGVRSYSYTVCLRYAIEACFEAGVEVVVLDRPNPLGGLKVDGPLLDRDLRSGVGGYQIPYVHGLTIGELASMAAATPGMLDVSEPVRQRGKLRVIPMRGWRRAMRWPDTGLTFVPTSPRVPDYAACIGYAMTGLGCQLGGFSNGVGTQYPFRGLFYRGRPVEQILRDLESLHTAGISFRKVSVTKENGQPAIGVYVEVNDWDDWRPTELSFRLMRLSCQLSPRNPFAAATSTEADLFRKHVGSREWWKAITHDGAKVDVDRFLREWQAESLAYQQQSRRFWLYN